MRKGEGEKRIRTGVFGGSFNPIHNGHISLALQLKEMAGIDEVWLMVSPLNPLKQESELVADTQRLEMARRALEGVEGIKASDYEMHLPKPSYTWNTLEALSKDYPQREFVLLIGGDNWTHFSRWYRHEDILDNYRVLVYPRKGEGEKVRKGEGEKVRGGEGEIARGVELIDISSTEIRERIRMGKDIAGMVPQAVADYIREEGLYLKNEN